MRNAANFSAQVLDIERSHFERRLSLNKRTLNLKKRSQQLISTNFAGTSGDVTRNWKKGGALDHPFVADVLGSIFVE